MFLFKNISGTIIITHRKRFSSIFIQDSGINNKEEIAK